MPAAAGSGRHPGARTPRPRVAVQVCCGVLGPPPRNPAAARRGPKKSAGWRSEPRPQAPAPTDREARARAAAVAESERAFLREFADLLDGGLDVVIRRSTEDVERCGGAPLASAALTLEGRKVAWTSGSSTRTLPLSNLRCVGAPLPQELGRELSQRSFLLVSDGDATLVHAVSDDVAQLCVAGFGLLAEREKARPTWKTSARKNARVVKTPLAPSNRHEV